MQAYPCTRGLPALREFLDGIGGRGVPPKVDKTYLDSIGLKAAEDKRIVRVLKLIGFLSDKGVPTDYYKGFRTESERAGIMGKAVKQAYGDLFGTYPDAQRRDPEALSDFFAGKTTASKQVQEAMVRTFKTLCTYADFEAGEKAVETAVDEETPVSLPQIGRESVAGVESLHINIQLQLPVTTEKGVYEALFSAMRKYILETSEQ